MLLEALRIGGKGLRFLAEVVTLDGDSVFGNPGEVGGELHQCRIDVDADTSLSVARADVAAVVAASVDEPATSRRTVRFNTGDVPIAEALRGANRERVPTSILSRGVAGTIGEALVVTLPAALLDRRVEITGDRKSVV
mgnify:CR=1 FL=1